jgi:hypothetical protein
MHGVPMHIPAGSKQRFVAELHVPPFGQSALNMHAMPLAVQSVPPPVLVVALPMHSARHSTGLQMATDLKRHTRQLGEAAAQNGGHSVAPSQPVAVTLPQISAQVGAAVPVPVEPLPAVAPLPELPVLPPAPLLLSLPPQPANAIIPAVPMIVTRPIVRLNIVPSPSR